MKYITKIENISEIYSLSNDLYFVKDGNLMDLNFKKIIGLLNSNCVVDKTLYSNTSKELYYFDTLKNEFILVSNLEKEVIFFEPINKNEFIALIGDNENEVLIKYSENEIIWKKPYSPAYYYLLSKNIFLLRDNFNTKKITNIDLKTGNPLWLYSLPEGFKIEGKIHLYDNILVVNQIDEQSCSIIVGLDILTGKKLWENKVSLIHYQQKNDFLYGFASNTFGDNVFSKINIKTGEVFEKSFENFAKQVASHLATIHNDNLYFSAYKIGEIGIIDLQKQEIIQEFSLNLEKGVGIGAPIVTEDKIYILDSLNTLHIFEK